MKSDNIIIYTNYIQNIYTKSWWEEGYEKIMQ